MTQHQPAPAAPVVQLGGLPVRVQPEPGLLLVVNDARGHAHMLSHIPTVALPGKRPPSCGRRVQRHRLGRLGQAARLNELAGTVGDGGH